MCLHNVRYIGIYEKAEGVSVTYERYTDMEKLCTFYHNLI